MRSTITLNGKNSSEIAGLLIQTLPPISKPLVRTQIEEIDGRDGDIVTKLGFSAYDKEFTIGLYGDYDVDEVIGYFNSEGTVTFSNEPDKYYYYQIVDQIDFEKLIRFKTATVTMHCQPFKYSTIEKPEIFENVENLVSIPDFTKTTNGITVNVENGVISVNGTGSAATEFYIPITSLTLAEGDYVLRALGTGTSPEACSVRVIYNSPSAANSFGSTYTTLQNNTTVTITATITQDKTYNYIYLYITPNMSLDFTLDLRITVTEGLVSGEGNFISLQETSLVSFNKFGLKGDTDQTNYSGKNLSPYPYYSGSSLVAKGITFAAASDGSITINGTNDDTGNSAYYIYNNTSSPLQLEAGTYYFIPPSDTNVTYVMYDGSTYTNFNRSNNYSQTLPSAKSVRTFYIQVAKGNTTVFDNLKIYPMLTTLPNQTEADYEPYVGGVPAPNPSYPQDIHVVTGEQTVNVLSRNLYLPIPKSTPEYGISATYNNNTGEIALSGTGTETWSNTFNSYPIQLPAGTYTISISNAIPLNMYVRFMSVDNTWVDGGIGSTSQSKTTTITVAKPIKDLRLWVSGTKGTNVDNVRFKVQVEYGSTKTDFDPYQHQSYTINLGNTELCKIGTNQDCIYKDGDDWYLHKEVGKVILDGSETFGRIQLNGVTGWYYYFTSVLDSLVKTGTNDGFSNSFRTVSSVLGGNEQLRPGLLVDHPSLPASSYISVQKGTSSATNILRFSMPDSLISSVADFKAWLASNRPAIYYRLDIPTDTKITDNTLLAQLEPLTSQAYSYDEKTHLVSTSTNLPVIMSVEAIKANKATIINSGNTIAKPTLTIYGAGDIGVYLNGFQVFKVALGDEGYITIDTNLMEAYKDTPDNLKNRLVDGDYTNFVLLQGESQITFSGSVDRCVIENYSRWL